MTDATITRRHIPAPIPIVDDCRKRFRCDRLRATMSGESCARSWLRINEVKSNRVAPDGSAQTNDERSLSLCVGCMAGAARASEILSISVRLPKDAVREPVVEVPLEASGIMPPPPRDPRRAALNHPLAIPPPRRLSRPTA